MLKPETITRTAEINQKIARAFEKDIPAILRKLGFDGETADFMVVKGVW